MSVNLAELALADVRFDEPVFGRAARISVGGSLNLARGVLESDLAVRRLDGPGGELTLRAGFSNATRQLDVDLDLHEPQGGHRRHAAPDRGRAGDRPDRRGLGAARRRRRHLRARRRRHAASPTGSSRCAPTDEGLGFDVDFSGEIAPLVPPDFRDFFAGESTVAGAAASARRAAACGSPTLDGRRRGAAARRRPRDRRRRLPARPDADRHARRPGRASRWCCRCRAAAPGCSRRRCTSTSATPAAGTGSSCSTGSRRPTSRMEDVTLRLGGLAQNLEDPARRNVTINVEGLATGVWHADPEVARGARRAASTSSPTSRCRRRRRSRSASCS